MQPCPSDAVSISSYLSILVIWQTVTSVWLLNFLGFKQHFWAEVKVVAAMASQCLVPVRDTGNFGSGRHLAGVRSLYFFVAFAHRFPASFGLSLSAGMTFVSSFAIGRQTAHTSIFKHAPKG